MLRQVTGTTDGKYVGLIFDDKEPFLSPDGILFEPTKIQDLGGGYVRYSNSHYVISTREIKNG
jgi:hypothetical protein